MYQNSSLIDKRFYAWIFKCYFDINSESVRKWTAKSVMSEWLTGDHRRNKCLNEIINECMKFLY